MTVVAWPPPIPPNTRTNTTPMVDVHAADHNQAADALDTIVARLGGAASSVLGYTEVTAAQSNIQTTAVDLTGLTLTFTLTARRRVELVGSVYYTKAGPDTSASVFAQISTAANAEVQGRGAWCNAPGYAFVHMVKLLTLDPGTYTYKLRASTGAGFLNTAHNASEPGVIMARDLGPG